MSFEYRYALKAPEHFLDPRFHLEDGSSEQMSETMSRNSEESKDRELLHSMLCADHLEMMNTKKPFAEVVFPASSDLPIRTTEFGCIAIIETACLQ
ncbi:hypothetical protein [Dubosiella newyorkensis]|uniref:hypothetical protein n=1 Tax=Dubosiella newyorkensis TaxID=1862672 RepID=UPI003F668FE3